MLKTRIIPCLQLLGEGLVKTVQFRNPRYIGDPVNTCKIFNELEVDELAVVDIGASRNKTGPRYDVLEQLAIECFMPLSYGGGVDSIDVAMRILGMGFEKVILNSAPFLNPDLVPELATSCGSQAVVIAVDVKKNLWGKPEVYSMSGSVNQKRSPLSWVKEMETEGAGEILLTSIDREGTWRGFDVELVRQVSEITSLPVIAHGGAASIDDIGSVVNNGKASAVALGSMVVFQGKGLGVLVNFPDVHHLQQALSQHP